MHPTIGGAESTASALPAARNRCALAEWISVRQWPDRMSRRIHVKHTDLLIVILDRCRRVQRLTPVLDYEITAIGRQTYPTKVARVIHQAACWKPELRAAL